MIDIGEIKIFISGKTGCETIEISDDIDIDNELGCTGDDFFELIEEFAKKFKVNIDSFLWYFHTAEEGQNIGGIFFKSPNERVEHIPVTPKLLTGFANKGFWDIKYPEHQLPGKRYDLITNKALFILSVLLVLAYFIFRCFATTNSR